MISLVGRLLATECVIPMATSTVWRSEIRCDVMVSCMELGEENFSLDICLAIKKNIVEKQRNRSHQRSYMIPLGAPHRETCFVLYFSVLAVSRTCVLDSLNRACTVPYVHTALLRSWELSGCVCDRRRERTTQHTCSILHDEHQT